MFYKYFLSSRGLITWQELFQCKSFDAKCA